MELSWWNLIPTYFDGTAFELGSFPVRWYGIMYIFAFVTAYLTMWKISEKEKLGYTKEQLDNIFTWIIAGILLGARLGYVFFVLPRLIKSPYKIKFHVIAVPRHLHGIDIVKLNLKLDCFFNSLGCHKIPRLLYTA